MSESEEHARLLDDFFKSLGEVDEESQKWKEYYENVVKFVQLMFEFMASKSDLNICKFRLYGSSAENLKNYSFNDVGDLDLLFFPGEDYVVDDNMLEYSPTNPVYAKIRAAGHPNFELIVVEDVEYVAASDVKELYPFVDMFKSGIAFFPRAAKILASRLSEQSRINFGVHEDSDSPAVTCHFSLVADSSHPISESLEQLKNLNFHNLDPSELEFIPACLCAMRKVDYTPQHAEAFDDFMQLAKGLMQSLCSDPSGILREMPNIFREIWSGEQAREIRNRISNIECGSQIESGSEQENNSTVSVTPEIADENVTKRPKCRQVQSSTPSADFIEEVDEERGLNNEGIEGCVGGEELPSNDISKGKQQVHECVTAESEGNQAEGQEVQYTPQQQESANPILSLFSKEQIEAFFDWVMEEKTEDFFQFLDTVDPIKGASISTDESVEKHTQKFSVDIVPALQARGWPKVAREWINRKRKWPSPDVIHRIIQEGFHLVAKPPKIGGCSETYFRLSFSNAEYLLSKELNDFQRQCYRGLKKYHKVYLRTEPKCLVTYHLKTIFLQTCEETGLERWTEENRTACMMKLFENLLNSLSKKYLRHFFVTACNLFDVENIESPLVLETLAVKVEQFMKNPTEFSHELITLGESRSEDVLAPKETMSGIQDATTKHDDPEGFSVDDFPRKKLNVPENATARSNENEPSSLGEHTVQVTVGTALHDSRKPRAANLPTARFHELKEEYLATCLELITTAVEGRSTEGFHPLERSFVDGIRELINTYNLDPGRLLPKFEQVWTSVYSMMALSSDGFTKTSMLAAMQQPIKIFKNKLSGNGILGTPPDFGLFIPADGLVNMQRRFQRIVENMRQKPSKQSVANMDDIPLD